MKQRIITGSLAGIGFLGLLYVGDIWFAGIVVLMSLIGYFEFLRMFRFNNVDGSSIVGFIGLLYFVIPWNSFDGIQPFHLSLEVWLFMMVLLSVTVVTKNRSNIEKISIVFIGSLYIGIGFHYMIYTRLLDHGLFWTLLLFACIWVNDSGAYFTGRAIGKRLLWPSISPKKTLEGAIGGIVFSIAVAICFSLYEPSLLEVTDAVWIGILVAVVGQLGDFIQSAYKRARDVKDTGTILPGHGGVLDRCDSWLIVFPFVHLLSLLP